MHQARRYNRAWLLSCVAILLIVSTLLMVPASRAWILARFIPASSIQRWPGDAWLMAEQPAPSPALEKELMPGMFIKAPAGALQGDEPLSASTVPLDAASDLARQNGVALPVAYGFKFDAGLGPDGRFGQAVTLELDLTETGIPEDLWHDLLVYRIGDGFCTELPGTVEQGTLSIQTGQNSFFVIAAGALFLSVLSGIMYKEHSDKFPNGQYRLYKIPDAKYRHYSIYWPVTHPFNKPRDPGQTAQIKRDIEAVLRESSLVWNETEQRFDIRGGAGPAEAISSLRTAMMMPAYQSLTRKLSDTEFLLRYVYPETVALIVENVRRAHDYLFEERGFLPIPYGLDIMVWYPFPNQYMRAAGLATDKVTKLPYMALNTDYILSLEQRDGMLDELRARRVPVSDRTRERERLDQLREIQYDQLMGTVVHEMFHVVQEEYKNHLIPGDIHFLESTAVLAEREAIEYWNRQGLLRAGIDQYKNANSERYDLFELPWSVEKLRIGPDSHELNSYHGYTFFHVLQHNRDNHPLWRGNPNAFLPALMTQYSSNSPVDSLSSVSAPGLMRDYTYASAAALASSVLDPNTGKLMNIRILSAAQPVFTLMSSHYWPYSVLAINGKVTASNRDLLLIQPNALESSQADAADWLGLSVASGQLSANMTFHKIKVDRQIHVQPATDFYLLLAQDLTRQGRAVNQGYTVRFYLASQPAVPQVRFDKESQSFVFTLPASQFDQTGAYRGRLLEISASHPDIKAFKTLVPAGVQEVRIPIESIIYGEDNQVSVLEQVLARGMVMSLQTSLRLAKRYPMENLQITEENGCFVFTKLDAGQGNSDEDPEEEANPFLNQSFSLSMATPRGQFNVTLKSDLGYYVTTQLSLGELLDYLRYARTFMAKSGKEPEISKELEKFESQFTATIRDVFSDAATIDPYAVQPGEALINKSAPAVGGPASQGVDFHGEPVDLAQGVLPGTYRGAMFVSFDTNFKMDADLSQLRTMSAVVGADQTVRITLADEILHGRLIITGIKGRFQYEERVVSGDTLTYRPVQGAFASFSEDGTLVFSFIPVRFRRIN